MASARNVGSGIIVSLPIKHNVSRGSSTCFAAKMIESFYGKLAFDDLAFDNFPIIKVPVGSTITRSNRRARKWVRRAADLGHAAACLALASRMYEDWPHAREVGHVGEAAKVATPAGVTEEHDVPSDVLIDVVHWLRNRGCC